MQHKLKNLTEFYGIYNFWKNEAKNLPKKDENLILCDFDDTIFSRKDQLEINEMLFKNRWDAGTKIIINEMGIEEYINTFVANKSYPRDIINTLDTKKDLILTAGIYETQIAKIRACWLENYQVLVTPSWQDKILSSIRYVLFTLKYLPKTITLYEDRPEYFIEYRDLIEDVLETKLIIKKVVMHGNTGKMDITEM